MGWAVDIGQLRGSWQLVVIVVALPGQRKWANLVLQFVLLYVGVTNLLLCLVGDGICIAALYMISYDLCYRWMYMQLEP